MKGMTYRSLIIRSNKIAILLILLVVGICTLSAISVDRPTQPNGRCTRFLTAEGDFQSIAVRPSSLSKEVKNDTSPPHAFNGATQISPAIFCQAATLVTHIQDFTSLKYTSLYLFLRVIRR